MSTNIVMLATAIRNGAVLTITTIAIVRLITRKIKQRKSRVR